MMERKRIVIIGGVAGGASAAARARRLSEDAEIVLLERGEYISFANCGMPYYIGGAIPERERLLVQTPESMHQRFRIDVRTRHEAVRIDRQAREVTVKNLATGEESTLSYDELILSPGAKPVRPPIPGLDSEKVFTLRNIADMDAIKKVVDEARASKALVIGGGYIGLEMAEALRERKVDVTLVELSPQVMGMVDAEMASPLHQQLQLHGVDLRLGISITEVREQGEKLEAVLSSGDVVSCDLAILAIGVRPEVELAREAGLKIGELGGIAVDKHMRTSDPNIYAVGDAVEVEHFVGGFSSLIPLAGPANRQGRIAADNIFGRDSEYRKTQGTAICKVFDLAIGATGLSERAIRKAGMSYEKIYVHPASHAGYYPGASPITLKLIFDPQNGTVLGAQAVGSEGVDKRIDVIATAIRAGMTVMDLKDLELSYAPPYGSAKDPVNYAGFVASNVISGDMRLCHVDEVSHPAENQLLLDVRTAEEVQTGTLPGAVHIPVDELRERLGELPKEKEILAFCQVGLRGYVACRILNHHGFTCRNLTGGYKTYQMAMGFASAPSLEVRDDTGAENNLKRNDEMTKEEKVEVVREIDACALQCPGPIMRLKTEIESAKPGQAVAITTKDPAFAADVQAWCHSTGNSLYKLEPMNGSYRATVVKRDASAQPMTESQSNGSSKKKTIVVFSQDFDRAMAAFIIANGAAAMGSEVTLFFTFWGINILRKGSAGSVRKNLIERMFGLMMPKGAEKLKLSKMNMGGMGTRMMKGIMTKKHVPSLSALIGSAKLAGVKLVVCSMSMDLMGIKPEELIDGVEQGGVAMYLDKAEAGNVNLFI
jgi:NADPH-dependent 2,4-dienoyl-CoA reductase/sulfur reductase-like enzyme/peroxiredoxin family protein/rhodanese-related sulfurtransferase/TusA-related sulfurtransferase